MKKKVASKKQNRGIVLIKKSNNLVESRYKFGINETRFFLSVLSQIRMEDHEFKVYRIWYKDVINTFDLKSGDSYALLREAAKSLQDKAVYINYEENGIKREKRFHLIRSVDYMKEGQEKAENALNHEYIEVQVEQDLKPFFLQLQKNFTAYDLRNVIKLGVYSVRVYELLKQYESIGTRTLKIVEMKSMFDIQHEYKKYNDFYRNVIETAQKEIDSYTDLLILSIDKIKEGRKVVALRFKFRPKTEEELNIIRQIPVQKNIFEDFHDQKEEIIEEEIKENQQSEKDRLFLIFQLKVVNDFGVSPSIFLNELDNATEEQVNQAIRVTERLKREGKVKNISGFFIEALRKGYTDIKEESLKKKTIDTKVKYEEEKITQKIEALKSKLLREIRNKVKEIAEKKPNETLIAISTLQNNPIHRLHIEKQEIKLERKLVLEDYRNDEKLRNWIRQIIHNNNENEFVEIKNEFEKNMSKLKNELNAIRERFK